MIQEHTGISPTEHANPYIYFQINGIAYARKMQDADGNPTDYAKLNIRLEPGVYQINVLYIDTSWDYEHPIYASQQILVNNTYSR